MHDVFGCAAAGNSSWDMRPLSQDVPRFPSDGTFQLSYSLVCPTIPRVCVVHLVTMVLLRLPPPPWLHMMGGVGSSIGTFSDVLFGGVGQVVCVCVGITTCMT